MTYLLTQMFLYMLVTFLLGLLLGWLLWRYGRPTSTEIDTMRDENKRLRIDLDTCNIRTAKLEAQVEAPRATPAAFVAAPIVTTPAPEVVKESTYDGPSSKPEGLSGPRGGTPDELQLIHGVGPKMESLLHSLGYYHFDQIAQWTGAEVAWVDNNLEGFKGRVTRDEWQRQAKVFSKG